MKRFFIIASMAILAIGCQKTEIQNEVQNQIGFSTETGKLTRAIVQNGEDGIAEYPTTQPFGVYAYGYQMETVTVDEEEVTRRKEGTTSYPMVNVEISYDDNETESVITDDAWRATGNVRYYWPNDPRTRLDFYAYSPAQPEEGAPTTANLAPHQKLTGTISHDETDGLTLTDYEHSNMYVDFMVAEPVVGATYSVPATGATAGEVPLSFGHKMTQVNFTVKIADNTAFPDVDFTINSIVLNNIKSQGTYTYSYTPATEEEPAEVDESWTFEQSPVTSSYKIYPATTAAVPNSLSQGDNGYSYGAPALTNIDGAETKEVTVILETDATPTTPANGNNPAVYSKTNPGKSFSTTPVTMIPQGTWENQSFTISYTISGTGVATETVVKTFNFADALTTAPTWDINKKVTYTLTISLNEITFAPTVTTWSEENAAGSFTDDPSNV